VHLNPIRAGIVNAGTQNLLDYPWSSLGRGYAISPQKRPSWLKTDDGFGILGLADSVKGRRQYIRRLEDLAREGINPPVLVERQSLQSTLHRGWYWGSEPFRDFLLKMVDAAAIRRNRNYQSVQMGRDHAQAEAERIVQEGLQRFGLSESDLKSLPGSDPRKVAIAKTIHENTTILLAWTAKRLQMKSAANVSQQLIRGRTGSKRKAG
jgi:hypothetical protein